MTHAILQLPLVALMLASGLSQPLEGPTPLFSSSSTSRLSTGFVNGIPHNCRVEVHPGYNTYVTLACPSDVCFLDLSHSDQWTFGIKSGFQGRSFLFAVECS